MILLTSVTDKLRLTTSAAVTTDVHASWIDNAAGTITPGRTNSAITTATTTDIVGVPGGSTQRNIKTLHIRNKHATLSQQVTIIHTDGTTAVELHSCTLTAGQALQYVDGQGFEIVAASLATASLTAISRNIQSDLIRVTSVLEGDVSIDPTTLINGPLPEPTTQFKGFTTANIAEVEANTRAMRSILRPRDFGATIDTQGFDVNRYQMSVYSKLADTTNAASNAAMMAGMWLSSGFAVVQKVVVSAVLEALVGARNTGAMNLRYRSMYPCYIMTNQSGSLAYPTGSQTLNQVGYNSQGLRNATQNPPRLFLMTSQNLSAGSNLYNLLSLVRIYGETLGTVRGGPQNVLGNLDVPSYPIFDASVQQPHIIEANRGFGIELDCPSAVTSYTVTICTTITWDEWVPTNASLN
jgi:hypothetical protein